MIPAGCSDFSSRGRQTVNFEDYKPDVVSENHFALFSFIFVIVLLVVLLPEFVKHLMHVFISALYVL